MKEQSTSKGFAILSSAAIAGKFLSIIYVPFLLKIIGGNRPYAIYGVAYQIYAYIYILTNAGIPSAISKIISEFVAVGNTEVQKRHLKYHDFYFFFWV
ncbi:oligosaccharide flippase family protein [Clostridium estertheticum]|uniref:oligosaccharide flippase family protein n=1 Tax=Clostridium estertheticum TaxID=238834 RepID=UPI00242E519C|nr:oligosaccharide flippase family protein [Clostridium estertheticum]